MADTPGTPDGTDDDADDRDGVLEKALNRVVSMNSGLARRHVEHFGAGKTGNALLRRLDRQYRLAVTGSGAAVGAAAIVPGLGTAASVVLTGGQAVATLEATMLYVLSYAEATGVEVDDVDRRRVLLMAVLLGQTGQQVVEKVLGNSDEHWGALVAHGAPQKVIKQVNRELRGRFFRAYGVQQGVLALARLLPFGAGAAVGGVAGAASSGAVIKATRRAFAV
ncbi:MAG: hypothetical protein ACR2LI_11830 [Propionibacteriaceae bacterium]